MKKQEKIVRIKEQIAEKKISTRFYGSQCWTVSFQIMNNFEAMKCDSRKGP